MREKHSGRTQGDLHILEGMGKLPIGISTLTLDLPALTTS